MRAYVKPELFYENFELAQNIANCMWEPKTNMEAIVCQFEYDLDKSMTLWTTDVACTEPTNSEAYCEYNSTSGFGLFNS